MVMRAPIPTNEHERLDALLELDVLDTPADERLDEIVGLAADLCGAPMAALSLVDSHRQWFKSHRNMPCTQTSRDASFCAHTIMSESVMVVA